MSANVENFLGIGKLEDFAQAVGKTFQKISQEVDDSYQVDVFFDIEGDTSAKQDDDFLAKFRANLKEISSVILERFKGGDAEGEDVPEDTLRLVYELANKADASAHWQFQFGITPKDSKRIVPDFLGARKPATGDDGGPASAVADKLRED